uniref:hypothetical protein n=1 Tax=Thioalkalivibrio sp. HK1 TaxID=1469245 RepID=UPI00047096CB|nr:hypothetical protein [Thioalkalivibrio sp. HK1]
MDRLQSIESRVTNVEANMATKKDLAEVETKVASMEAKMVTKDDMAAGMNTLKTDLLDAIKNMNGNAHR